MEHFWKTVEQIKSEQRNHSAPFVIDTPPPTVSGTLHMGHLLGYVHIDIIARYHKHFLREDVIFPLGFDDNGDNTATLLQKSGIMLHGDPRAQYRLNGLYEEYEDFFESLGIEFSEKLRYTTRDRFFRDKALMAYPMQGGIVPLRAPQILEMARKINWYPSKAFAALEAFCGETEAMEIGWETSRLREWGVKLWYNQTIESSKTNPYNLPGAPFPVYNTWCISALTPHWIKAKTGFYPTLRCHGHDITRTWTFYTLAAQERLGDGLPFRDLMVSGNCLTTRGDKMSKSTGNALDPRALIKEHGQSALRYWAARVPLGADAKFDLNVVREGHRLLTKLKNAAIFVEKYRVLAGIDEDWEAKCYDVLLQYVNHMAIYDYHAALLCAEKFFWSFCDDYIEQVKVSAQNAFCPSTKEPTLIKAFAICTQMLAPFVREGEVYEPHLN